VEIGNVEKKKKKEKGDLTNMTYMSAAWRRIIMEIYNEQLRKIEENKKPWYKSDQTIFLNALNQSLK
jgi:hypothetical protein